jgi:hypothetical protein
MNQRGRKSAASLSVVSGGVIERPKAPDDLNDEMKTEWIAVVNRMPADWFTRETHSILAQYCRHVVAANRVSQLIEQWETTDGLEIGDYDRLLKMQEREGRAISSLATRMRLTQQSKYTERTSQTASNKSKSGFKPWQEKP